MGGPNTTSVLNKEGFFSHWLVYFKHPIKYISNRKLLNERCAGNVSVQSGFPLLSESYSQPRVSLLLYCLSGLPVDMCEKNKKVVLIAEMLIVLLF